jgi:hypothetical protein
LTRGCSGIDQLTCVWLLTPPSAGNDGNRHFQPLGHASVLETFLRNCLAKGHRDVRELAKYLKSRPLRYYSYGDNASAYLTADSRATYFDSIPTHALSRSVVFFDPDNGLEPEKAFTPAHLRYSELRRVFDRMDQSSMAVVYQHLPRRRAEVFWPQVADLVRVRLSCVAGYVAEGDVGFLVALRPECSSGEVGKILSQFGDRWQRPLRIGPVR